MGKASKPSLESGLTINQMASMTNACPQYFPHFSINVLYCHLDGLPTKLFGDPMNPACVVTEVRLFLLAAIAVCKQLDASLTE